MHSPCVLVPYFRSHQCGAISIYPCLPGPPSQKSYSQLGTVERLRLEGTFTKLDNTGATKYAWELLDHAHGLEPGQGERFWNCTMTALPQSDKL
jgi:hypothetical protein